MAAPSELSQEAILNFMLAHGGRVTNHDLVKHFKKILTDPETRDAARNSFKEYVNTIATIRNEQDEKYLVLKKKYRQAGSSIGSSDSAPVSPVTGMDRPGASPPPQEPQSPYRQPPPYRPPPEPTPPASPREESWEGSEQGEGQPTPPVPPRRKSSDKLRAENKENVPESGRRPRTIGAESGLDEDENESEKEEEKILSVKEQMKKFNRLASENESLQNFMSKKAVDKDVDDDDNASVTSLDAKGREWLVRAAQADYQALAKLASDNPRLARLKDPATGYTALHWAAKHGNPDLVKMLAGAYKVNPNGRTNGGYSPLHIAMMFGHEDIFNLLVKVYSGDPNLRDWSGRKPRHYLASRDTSVSADTFRKLKARRKQSEKDLGFLRIGSLNVRVKKTTEAFSNFLGVGAVQTNERLHKTWGSADNIQQVGSDAMPPPKFAPQKKRRSKQGPDARESYSTPNTPPSLGRASAAGSAGESDSDNACGFDAGWKCPA